MDLGQQLGSKQEASVLLFSYVQLVHYPVTQEVGRDGE